MPSLTIVITFLAVLFLPLTTSFAGAVYQNFETASAIPINIWPVGSASVSVVSRSEAVHDGNNALKFSSNSNWNGVGVGPGSLPYINIKQRNNDRLVFWTFALPARTCYIYGCAGGSDNNVGVRFYDDGLYKNGGFEVWTTQTAKYQTWTKLKILFSQLPPDFDLTKVTKIEFKNYNPGNYYFDDIQVVREDRAYQTFEKEERSGSTDSEYGWKWNDTDTVSVSAPSEPKLAGNHSWKLTTVGKWAGTGIQSQDKRIVSVPGGWDQSFWNVDLAPEINDRLTWWVYALPQNGMDNNMSVQIYDNGLHNTDATKVQVWPSKAAVYGQWTRMSVLFSDLKKIAPTLDLKNINKIQFQNYWPGTFYIDDIRASGPIATITQVQGQSKIQWPSMGNGVIYRLQESTDGVNWTTIYTGTALNYTIIRISKHALRVRWEEPAVGANSISYVSAWSDAFSFVPPAVFLNYTNLQTGLIRWNNFSQITSFEVQSSATNKGPWTTIFKGQRSVFTILKATPKMYYRIRGIRESGGSIIDQTPWSRPQAYNPAKGFVKAVGTVLKDNDGVGDELVLKGVNLGGGLVIEPWMTGLGQGDSPQLPDDWSIRQELIGRFGIQTANSLLRTYQNAYISAYDYDLFLDQGLTLVRLPFYYRNFQDDEGRWILNQAGQIDFSMLDSIVTSLSDRGIYMVLDLHGAPGLQSADANTGRKDFNKLFAPDGETYRLRTIELWRQIALRYKNNPWVLGYDLLNEPVGVGTNPIMLADLYDRIYKVIRSVDPNHLIIMEGVWFTDPTDPEPDPTKKREMVDWDTLPNPITRLWDNVMYQFHFYHWGHDEDPESHFRFINQKMEKAALKQPEFNVPVMIGEFYGFGFNTIWNHYISNFMVRKWSWSSWSYKYHDSPSNWGVVNHTNYNDALPSFRSDTSSVISTKLSKYATLNYHDRNITLEKIFANDGRVYLNPYIQPLEEAASYNSTYNGQEMLIDNFVRCNGQPLGTHGCV